MLPFQHPALVIIDVQKGIDETNHWGGNRNNPEAENNVRKILAYWRKRQFPVFIIQHCSTSQESPLYPGKEGNQLKNFLQPISGEKIINKTACSAFVNTTLQADLDAEAIRVVVIIGFVTNNSVEATARMAGDLKYKTFVVSDATAAFDKLGIDDERYPAELVHQLSLANLNNEYATIITTSDLVKLLDA